MFCGHFSASLGGEKGQERGGDEHLPHLHLHLKDAVLSSSPRGRTRQGGSHAGEQGDPVTVNGGTQEGPGLKATPDLRQHHRRLPYRGSRTGRRRRGTSPLKVSPSHCGEIREGGGHSLTLFCNIYCSGTVHDKMLPSHTLFFARVVVKDKGGRHTMPKVLWQKVIKLDLGEAWHTLGTVSAEFLCLPHLHGGPEEI